MKKPGIDENTLFGSTVAGLLRSLSEREPQIITETDGLHLRLSLKHFNLKTAKRLSLNYCRAEQCTSSRDSYIEAGKTRFKKIPDGFWKFSNRMEEKWLLSNPEYLKR